jgi:hypothetical protein
MRKKQAPKISSPQPKTKINFSYQLSRIQCKRNQVTTITAITTTTIATITATNRILSSMPTNKIIHISKNHPLRNSQRIPPNKINP